MLERIYIENLKCFKKQFINFEKLTLLTGFNASGKSTTIQSLLLANQMTRHHQESPFIPLNGPIVKLGSVADVLNEDAKTREIKLIFEGSSDKISYNLDASERQKTFLKRHGIPTQASGTSALNNQIGNIIYLGALRHGVDDAFPTPENPDPIHADVGNHGQFAPWWLAEYSDEDVMPSRLHTNERAPTLRRQVNAWLSDIFPKCEVNAVKIPSTSLVKFELRTKNTEGWRRPANIGYGLSYAFPIVLASLLAKEGQILIIDSPEAHLHPQGQSKIGEFLARIASTGPQIVLETHSDHVVNGVRLAASKGNIGHEDIAIHFFKQELVSGENKTIITTPEVNADGTLSEWPTGFFDQSEIDMSTLAGWN